MVNSRRWQTCRRKFSPCGMQLERARSSQPLDGGRFPKTKTGQNRTKHPLPPKWTLDYEPLTTTNRTRPSGFALQESLLQSCTFRHFGQICFAPCVFASSRLCVEFAVEHAAIFPKHHFFIVLPNPCPSVFIRGCFPFWLRLRRVGSVPGNSTTTERQVNDRLR